MALSVPFFAFALTVQDNGTTASPSEINAQNNTNTAGSSLITSQNNGTTSSSGGILTQNNTTTTGLSTPTTQNNSTTVGSGGLNTQNNATTVGSSAVTTQTNGNTTGGSGGILTIQNNGTTTAGSGGILTTQNNGNTTGSGNPTTQNNDTTVGSGGSSGGGNGGGGVPPVSGGTSGGGRPPTNSSNNVVNYPLNSNGNPLSSRELAIIFSSAVVDASLAQPVEIFEPTPVVENQQNTINISSNVINQTASAFYALADFWTNQHIIWLFIIILIVLVHLMYWERKRIASQLVALPKKQKK